MSSYQLTSLLYKIAESVGFTNSFNFSTISKDFWRTPVSGDIKGNLDRAKGSPSLALLVSPIIGCKLVSIKSNLAKLNSRRSCPYDCSKVILSKCPALIASISRPVLLLWLAIMEPPLRDRISLAIGRPLAVSCVKSKSASSTPPSTKTARWRGQESLSAKYEAGKRSTPQATFRHGLPLAGLICRLPSHSDPSLGLHGKSVSSLPAMMTVSWKRVKQASKTSRRPTSWPSRLSYFGLNPEGDKLFLSHLLVCWDRIRRNTLPANLAEQAPEFEQEQVFVVDREWDLAQQNLGLES